MPSAFKRKGSPALQDDEESAKRRFTEVEVAPQTEDNVESPAPTEAAAQAEEAAQVTPTTQDEAVQPPQSDRASRFAALRARNQTSRKENLKETRLESKRSATDPTQLTHLNRKKEIAQHKLLKADVEESGEDFERKRAWDWTVEEAERWDEKMAEKKRRRENVGFQDYRAEAGKVYERQIGGLERGGTAGAGVGYGMGERREKYEREKAEAIDRSVRSGGLEIVEAEDGELIAVDKDGSFYSTADGLGTFSSKPDKASVDRLVQDIKKAEEIRMKKRRERGREDQDNGGDITYINEKNKQFNLKLARFYDKYTGEIRESFERGTAI